MNDERGVYRLEVERPATASQSLLARLDVCPFSGGLYIATKGSPPSHEMARGTCFHDFVERFNDFLVENDETSAPPEVGKELMQAVIEKRTDLAIPAYEQNALRIMAWNFAGATILEPETLVGMERTFRVEVGGWQVRGRIDRLEINGNVAFVKDYKTSLNLPDQEHFEEDFQLLTYGLSVADGGMEEYDEELGDWLTRFEGIDYFELAQVFPRYTTADGNLVSRSVTKNRAQMYDHRRTLEAAIAKLERGLSTGEWAATDGDHCRTCPSRKDCPIPPGLQRKIYFVETMEAAREVASVVDHDGDDAKRRRAAIKAFVDETGEPVPYGDKEWRYRYGESLVTERKKKDRLLAFIRESGHDVEEFFSTRKSTKFGLYPKETDNGTQ